MLAVKLWRFSHPEVNDILYLFSLKNDEKFLRKACHEDCGNMKYQNFIDLLNKGKIELILDLEKVPKQEQNIIPFSTYEFDDPIQFKIYEFFNLPEEYR